MKKKFLHLSAVLIALMLSAACTKAAPKQVRDVKKLDYTLIQPDKEVKEILGDSIADILFSPKSVIVYELQAIERPSDTDKTIGGIKVSKEVGKLDKSYHSIIQFLLADSCTYTGEIIVPAVPYKPVVALEFTQKKETVCLLFSFLSGEIGFTYNGKEIMRKHISNRRNMLLFFNNIMNNKDIKFYLNKK